MMSQTLVQQITDLYERFDPALISALDRIYDNDIVFEDPLHRVQGLTDLRRYFTGLVHGLDECRFDFKDVIEQPAYGDEAGQAVLIWQMHYSHRKLRSGKMLTLAGSSHLRFGERVLYHRDYFDVGAMLYEHIPVLGCVVRKLKKRLG